MKKAWFDGRLYLQGLKRLRVIGLALAILCISISVLIPLTTWIKTANMLEDVNINYDSVYGVEDSFSSSPSMSEDEIKQEVKDRSLIVPVLVTSYLAPVFVLIMFAYLNKRSESDFYHAIPYTRVCVYSSFVAASLTWAFSILIAGGLSAGLLWTLCPYTTYSFGGLICEILLCCLNAAFLSAFTTVGVSLAGTESTAIIASMLALCSWRVVVGIAYVTLEDMMRIVEVDRIWGGYLTPQWLLPVGLATQTETTASILYAVIVTLLMLVAGGLLYHLRRSETAGRSVPGRALQIIFRCLVTLPVALVLTYLIIGETEITSLLILFVVMLLVFYLYELLTSKSARSMLKATPWLGAVLAACLIFTGALYLSKYVICTENISADRIEEIGLSSATIRGSDQVFISDYERFLMAENMSDDKTVIHLVAKALRESQMAERNDNFYNNSIIYTEETPGGTKNHKGFVRISVCIKLKSGREMGRNIRMPEEEYFTFLEALKTDLNLNSLPNADEVDYCQLAQFGHSCVQTLEKGWIERVLDAMRLDHADMTEEQKSEMMSYGKERAQFILRIRTEEQTFFCNYYLTEAMPQTASVICELYMRKQAEAKAVVAAVIEEAEGTFGEGHEGRLTIGLQKNIMQPESRYFDVVGGRGEQVLDFLAEHLDEPLDEKRADGCVVLWMEACYDVTSPDGFYLYKANMPPVPLLLDLTKEEYETLIGILNYGKQ